MRADSVSSRRRVVRAILADVVDSAAWHVVHHGAEISHNARRRGEFVIDTRLVLRRLGAVYLSTHRHHHGGNGNQSQENYTRNRLEVQSNAIEARKAET